MILHWRQTMFLENADGGYVDERVCLEHPRISHMQQLGRAGGATVTTFHVDGIATYFGSLAAALDALRANPRPGDICEVAPTPQPSQRPEESEPPHNGRT